MNRFWIAGCILLIGCPVAVLDELLTTKTVTHEVKAESHSCACRPADDEEARSWVRCKSNGTKSADGDHYCCSECGKVCGRFTPRAESAPPVPVPLPPRCDMANHCKSKESCVIGGHQCCATCHQACIASE